ncbi:MAG: RDD family protein [Marinosulfonomonas sp.]|nr:RDD family protein [Marinosulfonomonas sp.]
MAFYEQASGLPDPHHQSEFYADIPTKRLFAFLIDSVIIGLICTLLIPLTGFLALFFLGLLGLIVSLIYRIVSLVSRSATPGMRIMSIEFRTHEGHRLPPPLAIIHTLAFTVSMSMVVPQVISIILMLTTDRAQGLTDSLLGTAVINK